MTNLILSLILSMSTVTGYLIGEQVVGLNKICTYDSIAGPYAITIPATSLCPLTIRIPN